MPYSPPQKLQSSLATLLKGLSGRYIYFSKDVLAPLLYSSDCTWSFSSRSLRNQAHNCPLWPCATLYASLDLLSRPRPTTYHQQSPVLGDSVQSQMEAKLDIVHVMLSTCYSCRAAQERKGNAKGVLILRYAMIDRTSGRVRRRG